MLDGSCRLAAGRLPLAHIFRLGSFFAQLSHHIILVEKHCDVKQIRKYPEHLEFIRGIHTFKSDYETKIFTIFIYRRKPIWKLEWFCVLCLESLRSFRILLKGFCGFCLFLFFGHCKLIPKTRIIFEQSFWVFTCAWFLCKMPPHFPQKLGANKNHTKRILLVTTAWRVICICVKQLSLLFVCIPAAYFNFSLSFRLQVIARWFNRMILRS